VFALNFPRRAKSQKRRRRKGNYQPELEGFTVSPEVASLDEIYIWGEITLDEKLAILHKMYRGE
jgi:hypothetical protein